MTIAALRKIVRTYYKTHKRDLPWRNTTDPYPILVSEIMLQQTQAERVVRKYEEFLKKFPTIQKLANADKKDVISAWQGLGYNRRAIALKCTAEIITSDHKGKVPDNFEVLTSLPGIGPATAGDILAFAFNKPYPVIETNIRTVFLHHFFPKSKKVPDTRLLPFIEQALDKKNPREWISALMDYGAYLKKTTGNASKRSKHYVKQSIFKGSHRQNRGKVLRFILKEGIKSPEEISESLFLTTDSIKTILTQLKQEGFM
ncbi:MAG: A/G-specific adenine glycosylase [Candidatus Paceibacterota bacterium]